MTQLPIEGHDQQREGADGSRPYRAIVEACERYLERHGDSYLGVGWTRSQEEVDKRYEVMLQVIREPAAAVTLLDFGCGLSHLYEYLSKSNKTGIKYSGLDLSEPFIARSRAKFPEVDYYLMDMLEDAGALPTFDYVVLNGVFTMKAGLSYGQMTTYFQELVRAVFAKAAIGIAFNVMSKQVDWERDDLFHLPFDELAGFLAAQVSRHFLIRHDYGLYEYTTYVYRRA